MSKNKSKKTNLTFASIVIGLVALAAIIAFVACVSWILSGAEKKGRESLEIFAEQTSLRLEDMLESSSNIMHQLKFVLGREEVLTSENILPILQSYRDNWSAEDVGLLFEDGTAVGSQGGKIEFENDVDPLSVDGYAYGVHILGNRVGDSRILSFAIYDDITVDGKRCIGIFMNFPLAKINSMMENTEYGNDESTFISLIDQSGDTIWRSNSADNTNIFDDLQFAQFESRGEFEKIKQRMELNYSGTAIYSLNGEKRALAYIPLKTNYWKLVIGLSYDSLIGQSNSTIVSLILVASIVVMMSMCITFYFIYRQRSAELSRQKAEVQAARAISETKAKSDFLSRMSHELRTPLNGIVGMIELALRYGDDKQKREDYLRKIKVSSDFLVSLINDILDMAKIEHNKIVFCREPFDIKALCRNLTDIFFPLTAEKNIDFIMDYDGLEHDCFIGDEMRLKQVLVNLLSNAVKFTDSGSIKCTLREIVSSGKTVVEIKVADTGKGINQEFIERIFAPFEQENSPGANSKTGTGLGLSICVNLVKLAKGDITVDSTVNKGSVFTVTLPLEPADAELQGKSGDEALSPGLDGINILLAEDNAINAEIAVELLTDSGAAVTLAGNGEEALQRFTASQAGEFDVILMDIQMPKMDGIQATKEIRASSHPDAKKISIIAMTANAMSEDREAALSAGMNDHVSKPFYIEKMCDVISGHCNKKGNTEVQK